MENCKHKKTTGLSLKNALQFVALKNNLDPAILGRGRKGNNKTEKFLSFKGCTEPAQNYQKFGTHTGIIGSNYFNRIKWLSSQEFYSLKPGTFFLDESKKFQSFWIISYTIAMELCYHTPFRLPILLPQITPSSSKCPIMHHKFSLKIHRVTFFPSFLSI